MTYWENLIHGESKGKRSATDLDWWPDARFRMSAYMDSPGTTSGTVARAYRQTECTYLTPSPGNLDGVLQLKGDNYSFRWCSPLKPSSATSFLAAPSPNRKTSRLLFDTWSANLLGCSEPAETEIPIVDGFIWEFLGAGASTQLLMCLLSANSYFEQGTPPEYCILPIQTTFNSEIGKFRAARIALDHLSRLYTNKPWSGQMVGVTSLRSLSPQDPKNNMVRNAISATAGVCGGAQLLSIQPWNVFESGYSDKEAARLSQSIFRLLKHESHIPAVADPLTGSFLVEELTDRLVEQAWSLFNQYRSYSQADLVEQLRSQLFAADKVHFGHQLRGNPKKRRVIVGQTDFVDPASEAHSSTQSLFPIPSRLDFEPTIRVEELR